MRRLIAVSLALAASPPGPASAATLAEIEARGTLRACISLINADLARTEPAGCTDDCRFEGLIVEQVRAFAESLDGVELELIPIGWSEQFEDAAGVASEDGEGTPARIADGSCDLYVSNLARLDWRERRIAIVPLFENRMIVMVRASEAADYADLTALAGKTTSVQAQSSFHGWLLDLNAGLLADDPVQLNLSGPDAPFNEVAEGLTDFAVTAADIAVLAMNDAERSLAPAFAVGAVQELGWGMDREAVDLQARVAAFFDDQRRDPASPLNRAWIAQLGVSIAEFEALIRALPEGNVPTGPAGDQ